MIEKTRKYHWRELPQVLFLSRQSYFFAAIKACLSRQKYVCRDKSFVATSILCRDKHRPHWPQTALSTCIQHSPLVCVGVTSSLIRAVSLGDIHLHHSPVLSVGETSLSPTHVVSRRVNFISLTRVAFHGKD